MSNLQDLYVDYEKEQAYIQAEEDITCQSTGSMSVEQHTPIWTLQSTSKGT